MKSRMVPLIAAAIAGLGLTTAQLFPNETAPFHLKLTSANASLDGTYLYACHSGAAIEQLCIGDKTPRPTSFDAYNLNYSEHSPVFDGNPSGQLVWKLPFNVNDTNGNAVTVYQPEPLNFFFSPTSNVAVLLFMPSDDAGVPLGFDGEQKMLVYNYVDDTVSPPNATGGYKAYYRWQACTTYFVGYTYQALAWATSGTPVNPSCQPVNVTREWLQ